MKNKWVFGIMVFALTLILSGCAGYDRILLATKTNVGIDIDSTPPTAEITIARRELAIQPTFPDHTDDDNSLAFPLLASFGLQGSMFNTKITAHFAGGDAAVLLVRDEKGIDVKSAVCLDEEPKFSKGMIRSIWEFFAGDSKDEPRPFFFATDTAFGVKVAWSGTAGPYPDTLKLGYNRKEFASAPIFVETGCSNDSSAGADVYQVRTPSFYASIDNGTNWNAFNDENPRKHVQFFATGKAASEYASRPYVRRIALESMAPGTTAFETAQRGLNKELIDEIVGSYNKIDTTAGSDDDKLKAKKRVADKANSLGLFNDKDLFPNSVTPEIFLTELVKLFNSTEPDTSKNLNSLRTFAAKPG